MVNIKMWYHPNYYKNLRKLYRSRNRDQAISSDTATAASERAPGTGLKLPGPRPISNANKGLIHKHQASSAKQTRTSSGPASIKHQAASVKLSNQPVQVSSDKHPNHNSKLQASSLK